MTDPDDPTGLIALASSSVAPLQEELRARIAVELDDRDALAVESALLKAFLHGLREGDSETLERVVEQEAELSGYGHRQMPTPQLEQPVPDVDPWAERYG